MQVLSGLASGVYKATAAMQPVDGNLPALWQGIARLDLAAVQSALRAGADPNERNAEGVCARACACACAGVGVCVLTQTPHRSTRASPLLLLVS